MLLLLAFYMSPLKQLLCNKNETQRASVAKNLIVEKSWSQASCEETASPADWLPISWLVCQLTALLTSQDLGFLLCETEAIIPMAEAFTRAYMISLGEAWGSQCL